MSNPPIKQKYIKTPEKLWELFERYIKYLKENPFKVKDWVGGMAKPVIREKERPVTLEGFKEFGHKNGVTLLHYFENTNNAYEAYRSICSRIREFIRSEQIEGGMAGIYNPSITQRLNNLVERSENKHEVTEVIITRES